jgi:hypothetical protein
MMAVRKTLNNELVVDPSMIEEADLLDPRPGKLLRLTRAAQNSGLIDKAVFPLPVVDVTAAHSIDSKNVREIGEEVTGASRLLMGLSNTGRRAATEVQSQTQLSSGRMKMLAGSSSRRDAPMGAPDVAEYAGVHGELLERPRA